MQNDHRAAYHALATHANPFDTLVYSREPAALAEAQRAYDAACELTQAEYDALDDAYDLLTFLCQQKQYDCIDFQQKIVASQKRAVAAAKQAELAALRRLRTVRDAM